MTVPRGRLEFLRAFAIPRVPFVLTGCGSNWPAVHDWSFEFLESSCGSAVVPVRRGAWADDESRTAELRTFLKRLSSGAAGERSEQVVDWAFLRDYPHLRAGFSVPDYLDRDWFAESQSETLRSWRWMYVCPAGSRSSLHVDVHGSSAWLAVLRGRKRVRMFDSPHRPAQTVDLFVNDDWSHHAVARRHDVDLAAGDILFIPSGWWHQVLNLEDSIAITGNLLDATSFASIWSTWLQKQRALDELRGRAARSMLERMTNEGQGPAEVEAANLEAVELIRLDRQIAEELRSGLRAIEGELRELSEAIGCKVP